MVGSCVGVGQVVGRDGQPSSWLLATGPPTVGLFWEAIAVPDLGKINLALAAQLMDSIGAAAPSSHHHGLASAEKVL